MWHYCLNTEGHSLGQLKDGAPCSWQKCPSFHFTFTVVLVTLGKYFELGPLSSVFNTRRVYKDAKNLLKTLWGKQPGLLSLLTQKYFTVGTSTVSPDLPGSKLHWARESTQNKNHTLKYYIHEVTGSFEHKEKLTCWFWWKLKWRHMH